MPVSHMAQRVVSGLVQRGPAMIVLSPRGSFMCLGVMWSGARCVADRLFHVDVNEGLDCHPS